MLAKWSSLLISLLPCLLLQMSSAQKQPRIAIIGAGKTNISDKIKEAIITFSGIGGSSTGYFLRQKFPKAQMAIIDAHGQPGGRLETVEVSSNEESRILYVTFGMHYWNGQTHDMTCHCDITN